MRTSRTRLSGPQAIQLAAISCLVLSLTACSSDGNLQASAGGSSVTPTAPPPVVDPPTDVNPPPDTDPPNPTTQNTPFTPLQEAVAETSEGLRAVPMLLNDLGDIADDLLGEVVPAANDAPSPMARSVAPQARTLSPVLSELGLGVDSLLLSTENGLGKIGDSSDPVGETLAGTEGLLLHTGTALSNTATTVQNLGQRLGPASAVTDVTANVVDGLSQLVTQVGDTTGELVTSTPVTGLTSTVNDAATPILGAVLGGVQNVGVSTGLAEPIDNLLSSVGGLTSNVGTQAQTSGMPVITPVGMLIDQVGLTVTALGSVGGADAAGDGGLLTGGLLNGGLLGGGSAPNPVTGLVGDILGGNGGGLLSPVTSGLQSGGTASPLAPVTNLLNGLTGGLNNIATPALSNAPPTTPATVQPLTNLLAPLTSLLNPQQR